MNKPLGAIVPLLWVTGCVDVSGAGAYVAVHLEVHDAVYESGAYQEAYWPELVDMVDLADEHDHKLMLLFTTPWVDYIHQDPERLALVRDWEAHGHELGAHHHPIGNEWDGYTEETSAVDHEQYNGDLSDMMAVLNTLPKSTEMVTFNGATEGVVPQGIEIIAVGNPNTPMCGTPHNDSLSNTAYTSLGFSPFINLAVQDQVMTEIEDKIDSCQQIFGTSWHAADFAEQRGAVDRLFQILDKHGLHLQTAKDLVASTDAQSGPPQGS